MKAKDLFLLLKDVDPETEIGIHDEVDDVIFREFELSHVPCKKISKETAVPWYNDEDKKILDILVIHHPCMSSHLKER